jgi:predicted CXXCH cytochrome family protein
MTRTIVYTLLLLALPLAVWAVESPRVQKPSTPIPWQSCVTADCHVSVKQHRILHGPVNVNACDACHQVADAASHSFTLTRSPEELCGFCHQLDLANRQVVHAPLPQGKCLSCHSPHGGTDIRFLRSQSMPELCHSCHENVMEGKRHIHGPVAAGACDACHAPHAADLPKLLPAAGRDLCVSCHQEMDRQLRQTTFVHEPVKTDCVQCHDAHASNYTMMVKQSPLTLCVSCHESVGKTIQTAAFQHSAVTGDATCTNCHTSHGGPLRRLMKDDPVKLCMNCHSQPVQTPDNRTIAAVTELLNPALIKHGPAADGSCSGCHDVHGADISRLLSKPYPELFYSPFEIERFDLCFSCHDKELVLQPQARGLTGFRNGDVNLHFAHVNKDVRGRTCRACHNVHASTNPLHIRESVPYGRWQLPINFTKSDTGGSCAPGCHQQLSYDRENPADPGARPASLGATIRE